MQIFIKWLGTKVLNVEFFTTIKEIKEMINEKFNLELPIQHYDLYYHSKPLDDDYKTVADYMILSESTIYIFKISKKT